MSRGSLNKCLQSFAGDGEGFRRPGWEVVPPLRCQNRES